MASTSIYDSDQTVQVDATLAEANEVTEGLTVTFQDVSIEVHGLGEDFGSTCLSVLADLIPFAKGKTSQRVRNKPQSV